MNGELPLDDDQPIAVNTRRSQLRIAPRRKRSVATLLHMAEPGKASFEAFMESAMGLMDNPKRRDVVPFPNFLQNTFLPVGDRTLPAVSIMGLKMTESGKLPKNSKWDTMLLKISPDIKRDERVRDPIPGHVECIVEQASFRMFDTPSYDVKITDLRHSRHKQTGELLEWPAEISMSADLSGDRINQIKDPVLKSLMTHASETVNEIKDTVHPIIRKIREESGTSKEELEQVQMEKLERAAQIGKVAEIISSKTEVVLTDYPELFVDEHEYKTMVNLEQREKDRPKATMLIEKKHLKEIHETRERATG